MPIDSLGDTAPGSIPAGAGAQVRVRQHLTASHFHAAKLFAVEAKRMEDAAHNPLSNRLELQHRSYVIAAVITATATLEASINDLFVEAADQHPAHSPALPDQFPRLMAELWEEVERAPTLKKYQLALVCAGAPAMERGLSEYQHAKHLVALRNALVHSKAEWTTEPKEHHKLENRLRGLFAENRYSAPSDAFFPNRCMGAGCAAWAVTTAVKFIQEHSRLLGLEPRLRDRSVRFDAGEESITSA